MANIISFLLGLVGLVIALVGLIPLLGIVNWLALPFVVLGIVVGQLAGPSKWGRNFCIVVAVIAVVRLWLGGGIL